MKRDMTRKLPVVEVVWDDCLLFTGGWESHENVMHDAGRRKQRTVGYVIENSKKRMILTGSISQGGNVFGTLVIPRAQIVNVRKIR